MHSFKLTAILWLLSFFLLFIPYKIIGESQSSPFEGLFSFLGKEAYDMLGWYEANGALGAVSKLCLEQGLRSL